MLEKGDLRGFKVGRKLWRISAGEVERFECQTIASESSKADGFASGTKEAGANDGVLLMQLHRLKRERPSENSPENETPSYDHRTDSQ
jgi:hypothetical protein